MGILNVLIGLTVVGVGFWGLINMMKGYWPIGGGRDVTGAPLFVMGIFAMLLPAAWFLVPKYIQTPMTTMIQYGSVGVLGLVVFIMAFACAK